MSFAVQPGRLLDPVWCNGSDWLRTMQQELVGLAKQRVNEALGEIARLGAIPVEHGGLRVLDLPAFRQADFGRTATPAP